MLESSFKPSGVRFLELTSVMRGVLTCLSGGLTGPDGGDGEF